MPLLRDEIRAARLRKVAIGVLLATIAVSATAALLVWSSNRRPRTSNVASIATVENPSTAVEESPTEALPATPFDGGVEDGAVVRVELPSEHVEGMSSHPVTEGAVSRRTSPFGAWPAFRTALANAGIAREDASALEHALEGVLDFRRCRPEHQLVIERDAAGRIVRFEYRAGVTDYVAVTRDASGSFEGRRIHVPIERVRQVRAGRVTASLGDALSTAGLSASLVQEFVEAFGGRADFDSDTRQGDTFRIVVDEERLHDRFLRYGRVHAMLYEGAATGHLEAYWYEAEGLRGQYYDADGRELRGGWLITPCRYDRLSSPFDPHRMHPILRRVQPHNGMDFAAGTGTPVWAAASGTITWAGPKGANGNLVAIQHGGGYQSFYAHLYRIQPGITRGAHVQQRQLIGQVGTTGRSTGPHLHFGLKHNNQFVDPAAVLNGPGRLLPPAALSTFRREAHAHRQRMLAAPLTTSVAASN